MNSPARPVISGTATSPTGPVALGRVTVEQAPAPMPDLAALTGQDGSFALGVVGPGTYVIAVHADGYAPGRAEVTVHAHDATVHVWMRPTDP